MFPAAVVVGGDPTLPVIVPDGVHPLLSAVGRAFAEHRPLVLSPDAVWLTIAQGVAQHVRLHAEQLRPRLVGHAGRKRLTVTMGPMPQNSDSWQEVVEQFSKLIADEVNNAEFFECDFSTSTDVERVAGQVVLLDAYSPYFALWLVCVCGIPTVTLTGTVEDWQKIRARVDALPAYGLSTWHRSLVPIADQFVRAASGDVDTAFWRRIYNPVDAYGGEQITGWAARFYPYLTGDGVVDYPNPLLELPIEEPRDLSGDRMGYNGPGIVSSGVPATLSRVTVNVNDQVGRDNQAVAFHAGLVGVAQDPDGALRPVAGWHLASAQVEIDDVIDRIAADHQVTPPRPALMFSASADLIALYHRIGSATLFDGQWRLLPVSEHRQVHRSYHNASLVGIIDLADGRSIAMASDTVSQTFHWVTCQIAQVEPSRPDETETDQRYRLADQPQDVPVYGTSLALLLDAALDSGGDISHLETGRLDELDAAGR
ncbi:hypothetical protein Raf01_49180 [Rugosimonospora africana]|uniref:DUF4419 domain-containing protein n=1 Tax=Rugosimonospora africana TaxID=556532 RepID=A0A8J3QY05_9ACTN|nr:hypothetical protein Raf01_49180 [Rugosimonospora africana]